MITGLIFSLILSYFTYQSFSRVRGNNNILSRFLANSINLTPGTLTVDIIDHSSFFRADIARDPDVITAIKTGHDAAVGIDKYLNDEL